MKEKKKSNITVVILEPEGILKGKMIKIDLSVRQPFTKSPQQHKAVAEKVI